MFEQSMAGHGRLLVGGMLLMTEVVDSFYRKGPKGQLGHTDRMGEELRHMSRTKLVAVESVEAKCNKVRFEGKWYP